MEASLGVTNQYVDTGLANGVTYFYRVTAVDASTNESDESAEASATPVEPNVDPVFAMDPVVEADAVEDAAYSSSLADDATDANSADVLSFRKISGPAWLSVASNGNLSGTPENGDVGLNSFTVEVADGNGGIDTAVLEISVLNTNDAPTFIANPFPSSDATEATAYSSSISGAATDPDGDALIYSKIAGPAWLIVASNGGLSGTPENSDVGLNSFSIEVSDGNGGTDSATLEVMVINTNDAPVFATDPIVGQNGFAGFSYTYF